MIQTNQDINKENDFEEELDLSTETPIEETKYNKRIDELIEDAEIEAELEAEKTIRSKNTRILTISLLGIALLAFLFFKVKYAPELLPVTPGEPVVQLPEFAQNPEPNAVATPPEPEAAPEPASPTLSGPGLPLENFDQPPEVSKLEVSPKTEIPSPVEPSKPAGEKIEAPKAKIAPIPPASTTAETSSPVEDKIKPPKTAIDPTPPAPARQEKKYFVQTGAFSIKANADKFIRKLRGKGFEPKVTVSNRKGTKYVVMVGKFPNTESHKLQSLELSDKGYKPVIKKNEDGTHNLVLGKFTTKKEAGTLQEKLSLDGFLTDVEKSEVGITIHFVKLGPFGTLKEARETRKKLQQSGIKNSFIP